MNLESSFSVDSPSPDSFRGLKKLRSNLFGNCSDCDLTLVFLLFLDCFDHKWEQDALKEAEVNRRALLLSEP